MSWLGGVPRYGPVVRPGLLRWPKSELFGRRLSRPQDRQVRGLLDVRFRRVVRVRVVRPDELHDLRLVDVAELQQPAPRRQGDLRVAERRVRLQDDLAIRAARQRADDALELVRFGRGQIVVGDDDAAVLEVVGRNLIRQHRVLDPPGRGRRRCARRPVLARRGRKAVVVAFLTDGDVAIPLVGLERSDRHTGLYLKLRRGDVERLRRRLRHARRTKSAAREPDRAKDRAANEELLSETAGRMAAVLLLLPLPLTLLFLAAIAARLDGHACPEYRPKLTPREPAISPPAPPHR